MGDSIQPPGIFMHCINRGVTAAILPEVREGRIPSRAPAPSGRILMSAGDKKNLPLWADFFQAMAS